MCRAARWLPTITPKMFTAITRSKPSKSSSRNRLNEPPMPALLHMTWSPPNRSTAASTTACTSSAHATSVRTNAAAVPSCRASASPPSTSTSATTTFAPSSTNNSTVARPSPLAPPVTIATFPASSLLMRFGCSCSRFLDPEAGCGVDRVAGEDRVDLGPVGVADRPADRARVVLDLGDRTATDERRAHGRVRDRPAQRELRQALAVAGRDALQLLDGTNVVPELLGTEQR